MSSSTRIRDARDYGVGLGPVYGYCDLLSGQGLFGSDLKSFFSLLFRMPAVVFT